MKKKLIIRILIVLAVAVVVFFSVYTIYHANLNADNIVKTETAVNYSYAERITSKAVIVRNETLVSYDGDGVLYYMVDNGDKVGVGSVVARVFGDESSALNYNQIAILDARIAKLKKLNTANENVRSDYAAVDSQISLNLKGLISAVNSGSKKSLTSFSDNLIYSVNQRQLITGTVSDFSSRIDELQSRRQEYVNAGADYSGEIKAQYAGYFVSSADGYESVYKFADVPKLTLDDFKKEHTQKPVDDSVIGKIISGLNWYVVCELSGDDTVALSHSETALKLSFPNSSKDVLATSLVALNQVSKQSDGVAVFQCNYMNDSYSALRNETLDIIINEHEGIRISKEALHNGLVDIVGDDGEPTGEQKEVLGVYIQHGSELDFREIDIIYSGSDFVIADPSPPQGKLISGKTVIVNDQIVVKGDDLYAGKVIK